ncbi:hypothetical protein WJX74_007970 [Apatococcus lobatus]|uniref:Uncharacterized protein n=1 Tax=Apatococcus lobatus TaxID=904363 RepID=A0AAW1SH56_9CHLO
METVTLTKTTVQTVHQDIVRLEDAADRYGGVVLFSGAQITDPPTEGWVQTAAAFFEPRKASSYVTAVRKMEGVAEVQKRADKVPYLPLEVASWSAERGGKLRLVLQGKSKGTMFTREHEKDGLVFGTVGRSNPVFRYFRRVAPDAALEADDA